MLDPILIVGDGLQEAFRPPLWAALGGAVKFFPALPAAAGEPFASLAVGVYGIADDAGPEAFARWAHSRRIPALTLQLGAEEALIGPLALPSRAGCWNCARLRSIAAAAAGKGRGECGLETVPDEITALASTALAREIRAIVRRGPESSRLLDTVLVLRPSVTRAFHRIVPLSCCSVCGGASAFPREMRDGGRPGSEDSPQALLDALAGWIDPRTGVIPRLVVEPPEAEEEGLGLPIIITTSPPHVVTEGGLLRQLSHGWGKGLTVAGAVLSAVGEAIERYSASLPDPARILWESMADLEGDVLDPRRLTLYSEAQYEREGFPYARFDPDVRHPWVLGHWLHDGAPVWVPAVLAYLSLTVCPEHLLWQGTSSGLAASTDPDDAALRAILELIERDAFLATWLSASPGRPVELDDSLDPLLRCVLERVAALAPNIEIYVLPAGACGTTVLCLALGDGERYPGVTLGLGTDLDPRLAVRQAILELGQTGPYLARMMRSGLLRPPSDATLVRDMPDHAAFYFPPERAKAFERLRSGGAPIRLRDLTATSPDRSLKACASALSGAGVRVALVDVTSPDVATGPFRVVRAISPDLQPLWYGHGCEPRRVDRLRAHGLAAEAPAIHPIW
jgi:ribosomal protein S12 methylthiotransferase accessory factor